MLSKEFAFFAPKALPEALALLAEHEGAKILSGGMSMVPAMNLGILRPDAVVSLNHVTGLDRVDEDGDALVIGAMTRHKRVASDPAILAGCPLLAQAASKVGDVQIRNRGTFGGSVAHADPAADYLPVVAVLGGSVTVASTRGERVLGASEFFVDIMRTALEPDEALVEVRLPKVPAGGGSAYVRFSRVEGAFAIVNAAAVVSAGRARIAIGGATATPVVVEPDVQLDGALSDDARSVIGQAAFDACEDAWGDLNGSAEYRREMAKVFAARAVEAALAAPSEG